MIQSVDHPTRLRPVQPSDVPAVAALIREVLAEFGLTFGIGSETDHDVMALPDSYTGKGGHFWVVEDQRNHVLGSCGLYPLAASTVELRKMYVHPAARGRGLGQTLLDKAVDTARAEGARCIVLDTHDSMTAAVHLYLRAGFVRDDDQIRGARCTRGYRLDLYP